MQFFYTVQSGDTLSNIAARWSIPQASLMAANNLSAPYLIYPGQQLSMPPGVTTYVVQPGDTLHSISTKYKIPLRTLISANAIDQPYVITPAMVLNVPRGVPYYTVKQGDSLYKIASKYNVTSNGQPQPDFIVMANPGLTTKIIPGMNLQIPYGLPSVSGQIALLLTDQFRDYIVLYKPQSRDEVYLAVDNAGRNSRVFWSPNNNRIAYIDEDGVISIMELTTDRIAKIDQIPASAFVDWSPDSNLLVYSTGEVIRIYDITNYTYRDINRREASYVQWFPNQREFLYEAKDPLGFSQIYRNNVDGSNESQLSNRINGPFHDVSLSPDGKYVLYTSPGASISEIYVLELSTTIVYKIPSGPEAKNFYPTWAPDSHKIGYSSTFFKNGKYYSLIRVSNIQGSVNRTLAVSNCYATPMTWSPDSLKIAYLSGCREDRPPVEVWIVELNKPVPQNVMSGFLFFDLDYNH
ncbi:LysM peptidoglycan-binding domain-containing protein [Alkalibaculum bacchi]|uniref:LysM peptidoglycan-binding domain-containing protein n=1 Tax=Alkalibaculum bacchi TaxID=645887 RepID=UPI0026F2D069|nr:LysM peptidoglycan-binding domain-containing protein [Alkalibaculum bacchi]